MQISEHFLSDFISHRKIVSSAIRLLWSKEAENKKKKNTRSIHCLFYPQAFDNLSSKTLHVDDKEKLTCRHSFKFALNKSQYAEPEKKATLFLFPFFPSFSHSSILCIFVHILSVAGGNKIVTLRHTNTHKVDSTQKERKMKNLSWQI